MDPLDTSVAPVFRFDIHAGATYARNAWLLLPKLPFLDSDWPKNLRSSVRYPLISWDFFGDVSIVDFFLLYVK